MFGIGVSELLVILVIALIVFGPNKLPDLAKSLGKGLAEFKKVKDDFEGSLKQDLSIEEENSYPKVESPLSDVTGISLIPKSEGDNLNPPDLVESPAPHIEQQPQETNTTSQVAEKKEIKHTEAAQEPPRGSEHAG